MAPIKQPVLRKRDYDFCHIAWCRAGSTEIEFSILNALLQEFGENSFCVAYAFIHRLAAKFEVGLEYLMATCRAMDNIGSRTVLRQDHFLDSLGRGALRCGTLLSEGLRVCIKPLEASNKEVFLPLPIEVDRGARQSGFFCNVADRGPAIPEIAEPLNRGYKNSLSRVFGFRSSRLFHNIDDAIFSDGQRNEGFIPRELRIRVIDK